MKNLSLTLSQRAKEKGKGKRKGKFQGKFHYLPASQREVNQPDDAETYEEFEEQRNIAWAKAESHRILANPQILSESLRILLNLGES